MQRQSQAAPHVPASPPESDPGPAATAPSTSEGEPRAQRADARRNRDALLSAAADLFAAEGIEVSLEEIARRASVGIGTLYRNFPNREALIEAAYRRDVETLCADVDQLLAEKPADEALETWMRAFAGYVGRKRGMAVALKSVLGADSTLFAQSHERIRGALGSLVGAAVDAGAIRDDVDPFDLMRAVGGICMANDTPGWADRSARLVALLMDGLRYGAPAGRPGGGSKSGSNGGSASA